MNTEERCVDAVVFDLDGVITETALVHSAAWKKVFDDYLKEREQRFGEKFAPFTHERDYLGYVDGKPRYEGVRSFLESRGISIPFGDPSDPNENETCCGIGNRKNDAFNEILKRDGVKTFKSTIAFIDALRAKGIRTGVASSSKNCEPILRAAGIEYVAETRVDGVVSAELGLKGKPNPDIFIRAAQNLGARSERTVIVEDAVSGVQAGRRGRFGLVLGIAREGNAAELLAQGADIVVNDLAEISVEEVESWIRDRGTWNITFDDMDPAKERSREALLTVGNGYLCTRGAMEEARVGAGVSYPGTYMAAVYNRLVSKIGDRDVDHEDLVNTINWLPASFRPEDGEWFDAANAEIVRISRTLDLREGVLSRELVIRDKKGRETSVRSRRCASMHNPHLLAMEYTVTPLNYSGKIQLRTGLHANHRNAGVERYKQLNQDHLEAVGQSGQGNVLQLAVRTTESHIVIADAAKLSLFQGDRAQAATWEFSSSKGEIEATCAVSLQQGESAALQKIVARYSSRDTKDPQHAAAAALADVSAFDDVQTPSAAKWRELWKEIDIQVEGDPQSQRMLRLNLFHTITSASPHNAGLDAGLGARGLHGEAYRGHVFWDEVFIVPFFSLHLHDAARALLMYRCRRLDAARAYAKEYGYKGAMFPWQSGSDGREETPTVHLNPVSGTWGPDHSSLQRHVALAVAYNVWQYYHLSGDVNFMAEYGAELLLEVCRFWASTTRFDEKSGRYHIEKVMGPDEFHEKYPNSEEGGLRDNAYTNVMVSWLLQKAVELLRSKEGNALAGVKSKIGLTDKEIETWTEISRKLHLTISPEGIIAQFDGYFDLEELDWDHYRRKYKNIYRLDRLLKAEGASPDAYKLAKQADVLMLFYVLRPDEVLRTIEQLGYKLPADYLQRNLSYYLAHTSHGSTLSRLVHSVVAAAAGDMELAWPLYKEALESDYVDIQGGTTAEGIHLGVMTGSAFAAITTFGGLNLSGETIRVMPTAPKDWEKIRFSFTFKGSRYRCEVSPQTISIELLEGPAGKAVVEIDGAAHEIEMRRKAVFQRPAASA